MNLNQLNQKIRYVTNEKGKTTDVLIPLETWENILNFLPLETEKEDNKQAILEDLKQSLLDGKEGKTFPLEELWQGIDN